MRIRGRWIAALVAVLVGGAARLDGAVNLALSPQPPSVAVGETVSVALLAISDSAVNQAFTAMDVILTWDPEALSLLGATNDGPVFWPLSGFMPDSQLDGLNDSFADGDAVYTVASFTPVNATPAGLKVTTFRFEALGGVTQTELGIVGSRGQRPTTTKVFAAGQVDKNVVGSLGRATVDFLYRASLSIADAVVPAGRPIELPVHGEVTDDAVFGVTLVVQLVPQSGAVGEVSFTPAPPTDIDVLDDPWPAVGSVTLFDTDQAGSLLSNGLTLDNGTFLDAPLSYFGDLGTFPVQIDPAARGTWGVMLCVEPCGPSDPISQWEAASLAVPTTRIDGTLTVVAAGDGDGSEVIDLRDFTQLQLCFTGDVGPLDPPAYSSTAALPCGVYDFDGDGDVDALDYADFQAGPLAEPLVLPAGPPPTPKSELRPRGKGHQR